MAFSLFGTKVGMTRVYNADGAVVPVTVLKAGPCTVIQKKTAEKDGYTAVQLGFVEERAVRKPLKPQIGHFKKAGVPVVTANKTLIATHGSGNCWPSRKTRSSVNWPSSGHLEQTEVGRRTRFEPGGQPQEPCRSG